MLKVIYTAIAAIFVSGLLMSQKVHLSHAPTTLAESPTYSPEQRDLVQTQQAIYTTQFVQGSEICQCLVSVSFGLGK
jgi:hypothetical protein